MGKYDKVDRDFFSNEARAAELLTVGIYHKLYQVKKEDLQPENKTYKNISRDILFSTKAPKVKYGVEIENFADYSMPYRFLNYELCDYEKQAQDLENRHKMAKDLKNFVEIKSGMNKTDSYTPVLNLLLYLGGGHWEGNVTMRDMFHISEDDKKYISDKVLNYSFPILEADYVNPNDFNTDLNQFFRAMQTRNDKDKMYELLTSKEFQNISRELNEVISVHLGEKEIEQKVIEEEKTMCKAIREMKKDAKKEGKIEGIAEGKIEGKKEGIAEGKIEGKKEGIIEGVEMNLLNNIKALMKNLQLTVEQAMDALNVELDKRESLKKKLQ